MSRHAIADSTTSSATVLLLVYVACLAFALMLTGPYWGPMSWLWRFALIAFVLAVFFVAKRFDKDGGMPDEACLPPGAGPKKFY